MPPQRTMPPAKAVKTERTHEENQERAYIAASRRSDRSLEARVESARRASEIHKRRTGRSLRVTEQDVVNEEMYEEEDDDLPVQYRRLTAHLQTGSADFNRRLAAYLTNHVAMRSALDQAITSSYAQQQYPNSPQFPPNQASVFPSPLLPPQMVQKGSIYGQSPYPPAGNPQFRPTPHPRAQSIAIPQDSAASRSLNSPLPQPSPLDRRLSMPDASGAVQVGTPRSQPGSAHSAGTPHRQSPPQQVMMAPGPMAPNQSMQQAQAMQNGHGMGMLGPEGMGPFSLSLPPESQMMLGPVLNPHDPLTAALMGGNENMAQPMFPFNPSEMTVPKGAGFFPTYGGMSSTLAPSATDLSPRDNIYATSSPAAASFSTPTTTQAGLDAFYSDPFRPQLTRQSSTQGSGIGDDWGTFIDDNSWEQNVV